MPKPLINIDALEFSPLKHQEIFEAHIGPMAQHIGGRHLGCNLTIVPPGKKAFPRHSHHANEEMFFILEGEGTYVLGEDHYPARAGDLLMGPIGGPEVAHQIINTSDAPLKYLAISTMCSPDITEYPDSGKYGVYAGSAPGGDMEARTFGLYADREAEVDYWKGEDA